MIRSALLCVGIASATLTACAAASGVAVLREMDTAKKEALKCIHDLNFKLGSRVDLLIYDWNESRRLRKVDAQTYEPQRKALEAIQADLNRRYEKLVADRDAFFNTLARDLGGNALTLENLEDSQAKESFWFMLRGAKVRLSSQETIDLVPNDFKGGAGYQTYSYQCPPAFAVWIYGKGTETSQMSARFFVDAPPAEDPTLTLSGQDQDKPEVTRIRIALNNTEVFAGPNGFVKRGWSEREFRLPRASLVIGGAESISAKLSAYKEALAKECKDISDWCSAALSPIEARVLPISGSLTYHDPPAKPDLTEHHFVRGMYYHGLMPEATLVAKALRDAGCNFILSYLTNSLQAGQTKPDTLETLLSLTDGMGIAVAEAMLPKKGWRFLHPEQIEEELVALADPLRAKHPSLVGVEFDEPGVWDEALAEEEARHSFAQFLRAKPALAKELGDVPDTVAPPKAVSGPRDQVLWMEWQLFKIATMRRFFEHVEAFCKSHRLGLYPIIVGCPPTRPQHASFSAVPAVASAVAQGSYGSSSLSLAFLLDLLRANAKGKTYLCPGSGYACKTAQAHERELSITMPHADGVWVWCWIHQQRYYVHETLSKPGLWEATQRVFRKMAKAEPYLINTESTAPTALVYSERTGIADSYGHEYGFTQPYYLNELGWYRAMLSLHRQCDAVFAEGMTPTRLSRYKVLLLSDARALTPDQTAMFRSWVKAGGTLIATANTSLCDEWGREQKDYGLADLFGVRYRETRQGEKSFRVASGLRSLHSGAFVAYDAKLSYAVVEPAASSAASQRSGAEVVARWEESGLPAVTSHRYGRGRAVFLSAQQLGVCTEGKQSVTELPGRFLPGVLGFIDALVGLAAREPLRVSHCPPEVEVTVRRQPNLIVVHLINHGERPTVGPVRLRVPHTGKLWRAFYPSDGSRGKAQEMAGWIELSVREFAVHDMVVVEWEAPNVRNWLGGAGTR